MEMNQLHLVAALRIALGFLTIGLIGCGGGSTDPGTGETVDFREYALPAASGAYEYDEYTLDGEGHTVLLERNTWLFDVTPGEITLTTDSGQSTVIIESNRLTFDPNTEYEFSMPRTVKQGDVFSDAGGQQFALFGPYKNRTFTVYGSNVQRMDDSVLIEIYRRKQDDFSDVYVRSYAKGIGMVGLTRYELCPRNVALDINLSYEALCADSFPDTILVNPQ